MKRRERERGKGRRKKQKEEGEEKKLCKLTYLNRARNRKEFSRHREHLVQMSNKIICCD
jgi:hypothetical protein